MELRDEFERCFAGLAAIGRDGAGGWTRLAWTVEDRAARGWFAAEAAARGLDVEQDRAGNLWAWWGGRGPGALAVGSHLDTVPRGGAFDGALGVVGGLLAVGALARGGAVPRWPVAVVAFADEEGGRFGMATFGSRVLAGTLDPAAVLERTGTDGVTLAEALRAAGLDPAALGPDPARLARLAAAVELHVEQGRWLVDHDAPLGLASGIWPHGRWRLDLAGEANHAGTTRLEDRHDPVLGLAEAALAARAAAARHGAVATVGRLEVEPNSTNSVAARVRAWLDVRAADAATLDRVLAEVGGVLDRAAEGHGLAVEVACESRSPAVAFDRALTDRLAACLRGRGLDPVELPTAAGHDAGVLAAAVPSAMLFVRNPTGVSHSPAEHAELSDCLAGVEALAAIVEELACR
ncbi:MAG TPA: allantoate amidohydrolase [Actinomycetes bacterium]|jgi:N-carbamoyl-L-amino-acid hydrolase|nr:allantoate amidohydrolase [Actinomycetes bacterium]